MTDPAWDPDDAYKLSAAEEGKYVLNNLALTANTGVKVYDKANKLWYPSGTDNNYVITEDGTYDLEFYPAGNMGNDYHGGFFKLTKQVPHVHEWECTYEWSADNKQLNLVYHDGLYILFR